METRVLTAHVPLPLAAEVDAMARRLDRSRGWIVKQALAAWLDTEEVKRQLTLEAMVEVETGHVVNDSAVQAWAEALGTDNQLPVPRSKSC